MAIAAAPVNRTNVNAADSRHNTKIPIQSPCTVFGRSLFASSQAVEIVSRVFLSHIERLIESG